MNKNELCFAIANRVGMTEANVAEVLDAFTEVVEDRLVDEEKVQIFGFGTFDVKSRPDRKMRSPRTGELIDVKARKAIVFKPGKALRELFDD